MSGTTEALPIPTKDSRYEACTIEPRPGRSALLAVVGVSIGLAATLNPDEPRRTTSASDMASPPRGMVQPSTKPPIEEKSMAKPIVYSGRVVDPDGKPVAGAKLHLADYGHLVQTSTSILGNSDIEGRFRFTVTTRDLIRMEPDETWRGAKVVATAEGFGPGWTDAYEDSKIDPLQLTIPLARDDVPIEGRIVDLEGRPVPGATIRPVGISQPERGDLSAWIESCRNGNGGSSDLSRAHLGRTIRGVGTGLPQQFTTDAQGRFAIRGIGRERLVRLLVSGPTIQTKPIGVMTRQSAAFNVTRARGSPNWGIDLYYGAASTMCAAPTKASWSGSSRTRTRASPCRACRSLASRRPNSRSSHISTRSRRPLMRMAGFA